MTDTQEEIRKQKNRYKVWLEQSKFDLAAAKTSLNGKHYEWVCYQSIQSVEKAIKSIIVHAGFRPPKVHKLGILLGMANDANKAFENVTLQFRKLESFTFISRYPFVIPGQNKTPREIITKEDAETSIQIATDLLAQIEAFLSNLPSHAHKDIAMDDYYFTGVEVQKRIDLLVRKLTLCEKLDVHKIVMFGSFARELSRPRTTTMDLLIVADTALPFIERIHYVREITRGKTPIIEPLIYTPQEFKDLLEEEGEGFLESALEEGKVLWEG